MAFRFRIAVGLGCRVLGDVEQSSTVALNDSRKLMPLLIWPAH